MANTKKAPLKKKPAFKLDPKRKEKMEAALEKFEEQNEEDGEGGGKIREILGLFVKGFLPKEIVAIGYNRSTVYRQTGDYKKLQKAPALEYYGYELFESRVQRVIKAKGMTREAAVKFLTAKDLED